MPLFPPVRFGAVRFLFLLIALTVAPIRSAEAIPGQNDAPVLDNSKSPELVRIPQGSTAPSGPVGTLVSALVDFASPAGQLDNVTDADNADGDAPASLGIAIISADATNGSWFYSTNGGTSWNALGIVTASAARALFADTNTRLYFQPSSVSFAGTSTITFRAWDQTSGTNGASVNTTVNGGTTSFSSSTDTASLTVFPSIFRRSTSTNSTNGVTATSMVFNKPTGTVAGDLMTAAIVFTPSSVTTVTPPSGWTLVRRGDGASLSLCTYFKVAGSSEPVSYTWTFASSVRGVGGLATYGNVELANPLVAELFQLTASSLNHAAPSITPPLPGTMLMTLHGYASSGTWTPPAGMTEMIDVLSEGVTSSSGVSLEGNFQLLASSGATGTRTAVASASADAGFGESIALRPLNYAPVLDATRSPALAPVDAGSGAPAGAVGTLVSSLVDLANPPGSLDNVVDGDEDAVTGLAITGANAANGTWYYSLDGVNWTALGAASDASARLLSADADNRLYFQPNPAFSGTIADAITFRAWDRTTGTDGASADASTNGGTTAFSRFSDTATLTVNAAPASPTATNLSAAEAYTEDTALNLVDIVAADADSPTLTATLTLSNISAGALSTGTSGAVTSTYNSGTGSWSASGLIADVNALLAGVVFVPTLNFNSSFTIATSVTDGVTLPVTGSKAVTGTAVNDAPTATNLSAAEAYTEDLSFGLVDIVASDVDNATVTATLVPSPSSAGSLTTGTSGPVTSVFSAGVWTASGPIANVNVLLAGVNFVPTANFNANFTIGANISDGALSAGGSKAVTGTAVNDTPTATNLSSPETYTEDAALNLVDIVASDIDSPTLTATLTLSNTAAGSLNTATSGAVTSTYNSGTGMWSASGALANVNALLAGLTFTPALNFNGSFTIATSVTDGIAPSVNGSKSMTGAAVNDAPTATNLSAAEAYTEDVPLNLVDIVASDIDNATLTATLTLSSPSAGSLNTGTSGPVTSTYNPGTGVWTAGGPVANINALLAGVVFTPASEFSGNFTITTSVTDGALTVSGAKSMTGSAVNDAPAATNLSAAETFTEDAALDLVDIVASDIDSPALTATLTLSNPSAGSLNTATSGAVTSTYDSGTGTWTAAGPIASVNSLLAGLIFAPASNFSGSFVLATSVSDGIAAPLTGSKAVTGTAVNDAPAATNLSAAETYTEDTALNLVDILATDIDNATVTGTLTLSNPAAGSLNTGSSGPVTSTYNPVTGLWSASGPLANVNALLAGLTFMPALDFSGSFTIVTSVSDGALAVTGSKAMTGVAVNDAATATNLSTAEVYTEDAPLNLVDIVVTDPDGPTLSATLTLSNAAAGSLNTGTSGAVTSTYDPGTGVWSASGPIAGVNTLLAGLTFTPSLNFSGSFVLLTSVGDGIASPVTGSKAMTGTAVNDAPTATNLSAAETYTEDTVLNLVDIVASDVDNATLTATLTLSNPSAGSLSTGTSGPVTSTYNPATGVWSASGAIANVNTLLAGVVFTPAPNFSGSFTVATSVSDGALSSVGSKAMSGTPANDAPTATNLSAAEVFTEDTPLDLTDIVASDVDSPTLTATLTLSAPFAGSLSTGTSGAVTSTFDSGTGVWSAAGAATSVNALLAGVTYLPAPDFHGAFTLGTSVSDGIAPAATGSKAMSGIAVNDAPQLADGTLAPVAPNDPNPPGQPVSTIFAGQFSDVDGDSSLTGIAVVTNAADAGSEGTWEYSSDAGTDWFAIGAVSDGPTALAISAASLVRFVPAAGFSGAPTVLGVRGLDATYTSGFSTTAGVESRVAVNTVPNGGSTAIAATIASLATTISEVTAAPGDDAPLAFSLSQPFPNPSAGGTRFHFAIPQPAHVTLVLFDVRGRQVARLADADYPVGRFQVAWDGRSSGERVAPGIYFARLVTPRSTFVRRLVMTR